MYSRSVLLTGMMLVATQVFLLAQSGDSIFNLNGIVYDEHFHPVPASHVINLSTHQGDVTDSLGLFRLLVLSSDTLLIRNIAFRDTLICVGQILEKRHVLLSRKYYALQEARIFLWGSTYEDFKEAITEMPAEQTLGESLGLPRQDPDYIPYDMDEDALKSVGFLLTSPLSYFYYNFNKQARSARKVYWLKKDMEKHKQFDKITNRENISSLTGLKGVALQEFLLFMFEQLNCDFKCTELQLYTEVHALWTAYQKLHPE